MSRIQVLDKLLANQIAAGEVIERPASIVKELLENSIDAGSTRIEIDIEHAGKQVIKIKDNGCGIHPDDLGLAVMRHATSKVLTSSDLHAIRTLGFRGEALASISAVAKVSIASRYRDEEIAYQIENAHPEQDIVITPCSHPIGTTITVQQLFYNTPARRKFLRTDQTEFNHIHEVVKSIALAANHVSFIFRHNGKRIMHLVAGSSEHSQQLRVAKCCGQSFVDNSQYFEFTGSDLMLSGWLGSPAIARSQTDCQYFYLNKRLIRDKLINHAIRQAYEEKLYVGKYPAYVLLLTVDATQVDVNVHPTKHEVRFHDSRYIHDFLVTAIRDGLMPLTSSLAKPEQANVPTISKASKHKQASATVDRYNAIFPAANPQQQQAFIESLTAFSIVPETLPSSQIFQLLVIVKQYALIKADETLYLLNLEQWQAEYIQWHWQQKLQQMQSMVAVPLLLPINIHHSQAAELTQLPQLTELGFRFELSGEAQCLLRSVPELISQLSLSESMPALIETIIKLKILPTIEWCATLAKFFSKSLLANTDHDLLQRRLHDWFSHCDLQTVAMPLTENIFQQLFTQRKQPVT